MRPTTNWLKSIVAVASVAAVLQASPAAAADADAQQAAARLLATTITVRSTTQGEKGVNVGSGASLGEGLIATFDRGVTRPGPPAVTRYRVTLPDGAQAEARPRVTDTWSGLVLLAIDKRDLPGLELAEQLPPVGGSVLTAAAAGLEGPLVSLGVLSGTDRTIQGTGLPPMLQCDVSTTAASAGAALVDRQGALLGIVAATSSPGERFGWSYVVPAHHVGRLLAARDGDRSVVLTRRRPSLGLTLTAGPQPDTVRVERVVADGPAARAGIRAGDLLLEAEGRKVRSAYQVVAVVLRHQPGDRVALTVGQGDVRRKVDVTLAGSRGKALAGGPAPVAPQVEVGPQVNLRLAGPDRIEVRGRGGVAELSADGPVAEKRSPGNEAELLRAQLRAYEQVIRILNEDLQRRKSEQHDTERQLDGLRQQIELLEKQLDPAQ